MSSRSHRQQWRRLSVIEPNDTMNYSHRISRRGPKNTYAHSMDSASEKVSRSLGSYRDWWQAGTIDALDPLKLALVKTELELCVDRRLLSRV